MAIGADDVALPHLGGEALPAAVTETFGNAELLVPEVVELEDDRVRLTAVDARVVRKELDQEHDPLVSHRDPARPCSLQVKLAVRLVVGPVVFGHAPSAVGLADPLRLAFPGKGLGWL